MSSVVRRQIVPVLLAVVVAVASACKNNTASPSSGSTTAPSTFIITETFTGTLSRNGAASYSFTLQAAGTITVTLTAMSDTVNPGGQPPNIGISLGTWDGAACAVQTGIFTDNASVGASINGQVQGAGVLCARVYDPASYVTNPVSYTLTVTHP